MSPRPLPDGQASRQRYIGTRAPDVTRAALEAIATEDGVTLSDVVRRALDAEIARAARRRAARLR